MDQLRVSHILQGTSSEEDSDVLHMRNEEKTNALQELPKYQIFKKWVDENGVIYSAVDYPVAFGKYGQLIGMGARKDVPPQTAFLFVPYKLIITLDTVRSSKIGPLLGKHPDVFKDHYDSEYLILIAFFMYEMMKGEESFWYPYLQIINISDLPMTWTDEELDELQDQVLRKDIENYRSEYEEEWRILYQALSGVPEYEDLFPGITNPDKKEEIKKIYLKAFVSIVTRCFGWGLPKTMCIPFADCINHHNVDSSYELVHPVYHHATEEGNPNKGPSEYYTKSKLEMDYNDLFLDGQNRDGQERKVWPNKTLNQVKKYLKRNEIRKLNITDDLLNKEKQLWDLDYVSTSEEEDNDSDGEAEEIEEEQEEENVEVSQTQIQGEIASLQEEGEESKINEQESNQQKQKVLIKKPDANDVVDLLLSRDSELQIRDKQARLLKIQSWLKQRRKFDLLEEEFDSAENFNWVRQEIEGEIYYAMGTKNKTFYKKGDQLFNCYGRRTNRFLLINYGFCFRNNKYNSLGFKVFVNYNQKKPLREKENQSLESSKESPTKIAQVKDDNESSKFQKVIRLKKEKLCEGKLSNHQQHIFIELLQYLRANLLFNYKGKNQDQLLASAPVDIDFELFIVACGLNLMRGMLNSKYKTTIEEDKNFLLEPQENFRKTLAIIHRVNQKEILSEQIKILSVLMRILARMKEGSTIKQAYCYRVNDVESEDQAEIMMNRIKLRKYLRELLYYQKTLLDTSVNPKQ